MAQDIRELMKNDKGIPRQGLRPGHEKRFEAKLDKHFKTTSQTSKPNYLWLKIAATFIVVVAVGSLFFTGNFLQPGVEGPQVVNNAPADTGPLNLSDLSPEFKKLENYYMANINLTLAQLDLTEDNKDLIDSYMTQLQELNEEYANLNAEMVEQGVNDQTVSTLIENLQLRLDLLTRLKEKLHTLKTAPGGETRTNRL